MTEPGHVRDGGKCDEPGPGRVWPAWIGAGLVLLGGALALNLQSERFGPEVELVDMPALPLAAMLVGAGALYALLLPLVRASIAQGLGASRSLLLVVFAFGLLFRLVLIGSIPVYEDDWHRYLWDGAVTAHGYNPYWVSPEEAQSEPYYHTLGELARQSGAIIERINHADVRTLYPPVAQAAFALAHGIAPFSLEAWRAVILAAELTTLVLLLRLLALSGRSPLWMALYWWNPVVVKELMNSLHMEAIVTPLVLGTLLLSLRGRSLAAVVSLGLAIGAKIWPLLLAPLVLRPLIARPRQLAMALAVLFGLSALLAWPVLSAGVDQSSGFIVYAQYWRNNSAHFGALEAALRWLTAGLELAPDMPGMAVRAGLAGLAAVLSLRIAWRPLRDGDDLMARAGLVTAALFLLSPSQFPWYAIWMLPFTVFRPRAGLTAVTVLIPVYYVSFHYVAIDDYDVFRDRIVWLIWIPVWSLLALEAWRSWNTAQEETRSKDKTCAIDG